MAAVDYVPAKQLAEWSEQQAKAKPRLAEVVAAYHALRRRIVIALHQGGVPVLLGTDSPDVWNVAGVSALEELRLLSESGLSPREVLWAATRGPAEFLGGERTFGSVAVGLRADLLLLDADPLLDVRNLARRAGVMVRGRWFPESALETMRRRIAIAAEGR